MDADVWAATAVRHGTPSGYALHRRTDEDPCFACIQAQIPYLQRNIAAPNSIRLARLHARAQSKASTRLRRAHPDEYRRYYEEAKTALRNELP